MTFSHGHLNCYEVLSDEYHSGFNVLRYQLHCGVHYFYIDRKTRKQSGAIFFHFVDVISVANIGYFGTDCFWIVYFKQKI